MMLSQKYPLKCGVFILFLAGIICVDESVFKKCEQSAFCRRLRRFVPQESSFIAQSDTLQVVDNVVTMDLLDTNTSHWYTLTLSSVDEKIFHFEIDEKQWKSRRYRVKDSLVNELITRNITMEASYSTVMVIDGAKEAHIHLSPFRLDFYYASKLFVSINSKGFLNVERLREKPTNPSEGEWEEEFNGFIDSKPRGPESLSLDFTFQQAEVLFGIPEHADSFILKDTVDGNSDPYRLYTLDVFSYELESKMALYGAVPVLYGHGTTGCSGIYWQNSAETWVDIFLENVPATNFISESGIVDVFVLLGSSPVEVFQQYSSLTGAAPLPQMYALGYHQSRWNYDNESDVLMIDSKFEEHNIPLDSIWLDIEYTDGKRYFTWDYIRFPNPLGMINNLESNSRHLTIIIDPHVKIDDDYFFHKDCTVGRYYVQTKDLADFEGSCWPGSSSYTDFLNPEARNYYADRFLLSNFKESTRNVGIWNDMNEPAVFDGPEVTMQKDNVHYGGWEHRDIHNSYGHYHVMATYDGLMRRSEGTLRPFILSRSHFAGTQRYSAIWTGDNMAEWGHLQASIKMCLSASVAGISFCGADVGGFFNEPSSELLYRWYQAAAFQPFFRCHAHQDTERREPWLWPDEVMQIIRDAIQKRYRLLPYWYTLFYEHERFGSPIMRPLLALYPTDPQAFEIDSQYLLGDQLLVAPVLEENQTSVNVYFPTRENNEPDTWYDFDDFRAYNITGLVEISVDKFKTPVFQRAGTIIAVKNTVRKSSVLMKSDPYTLLVALDTHGVAKGTLYVDDEESFEYRSGKYVYFELIFENGYLQYKKIDINSSFETDAIFEKIVFAGLKKKAYSVKFQTINNSGNVQMHLSDNISFVEDLKLSVKDEWSLIIE
ncbi:neutral alpha-glucosidase AB-like [Malaya genurostris]|uniref:neutral alpha-glucosidase AB-like n=1 Tax=Malaya genurostris TaxID=325434 RepID=UPI0026F3BBBB|nr:neutral alpha-glucosidase AB-like [Malaya genurostris]